LRRNSLQEPFEEELRAIADPTRIKFLGHINDSTLIKELHANAYAYTHGHEFGGNESALLKGLAYGNCVLALDTVFNREVLKDGEYGI
jgi:glycosyltransferase involved in cell wall biosynthesis